jgi:hypothetical protein
MDDVAIASNDPKAVSDFVVFLNNNISIEGFRTFEIFLRA